MHIRINLADDWRFIPAGYSRFKFPPIRIPIPPPGTSGRAATGSNAPRTGHMKRKEI
jgi:hypothetical protein